MAVFTEFSTLRDIALTLLVIAITFCIEFSIFFLRDWYRKSERKFDDLRFAWSFFLLSMAFNIGFFIISDFYTSGEERVFWIKLGYISILTGLSIFSNIQERALPWNTHNFFGILGLVGVVISIFFPHEILKYIAPFVLTPLFISLFIAFAITIVRRSSGILKLYTLTFIVGFGISIVGYGLMIDIAVEAFGPISYTIGTVFITTGIFVMSFSVFNLPSFGELDWPNKLQEIYLVHSSKKILVHLTRKTYEDKHEKTAKSESGEFTAGALRGIKDLIGEVTSKKGEIQVIDNGDVKLIFGRGLDSDLLLVAREDLQIFRYKSNEFISEYNLFYKDILKDKMAIDDPTIWKPAEEMLKQIFEFK